MTLLQFKKRTVVSCERCGQELTDPESIARGMGPECAMKQSDQFAAISALTEAIAIGDYFDIVAKKFLLERDIIETRLAAAKKEFNPAVIVKLTKHLQRVRGILVRRELQRLERMEARKAVA
jgi:Family of unknown function (DUF6011)